MESKPQPSGIHRTHETPSQNNTPLCGFFARFSFACLCLSLLLVAGCSAAGRLKVDYTNYEQTYAMTSNREVLLNLARLDQHDPTFFFKMGQIGTSYQMSAGLSGNGSYAIQGTGSAGNAIGGGSPTLFYQKNPTFQFIPVDDNTTALQLLKPIDPEIFYSLYQQGWRVDQLFRVMVDHIEFREPGGKYWEVIRNSASSDNAANYARFLRVGALAYDLQKRGYLHLEGQGQGARVVSIADPKAPPSAKDILDAKTANLAWKLDTDGKWKLLQSNVVGVFTLNTPSTPQELLEAAFTASTAGDQSDAALYRAAATASAAAQKADAAAAAADALRTANPDDQADAADAAAKDKATLAADKAAFDQLSNVLIAQIDVDMPELKNGGKNGANGFVETVQKVFLSILRDGFSVGGDYDAPNSTDDANKYSCRLVMRSLIGVMAAAAQEQDEFADLIKNNPQVRADPDPSNLGPQPSMRFSEVVPAVELQPILQLKWEVTQPAIPPLAEVTYHNTHYAITDKVPASLTPEQDPTWNRDVFRLISQLAAQVTVDISKFPLPSILQLNTQ